MALLPIQHLNFCQVRRVRGQFQHGAKSVGEIGVAREVATRCVDGDGANALHIAISPQALGERQVLN